MRAMVLRAGTCTYYNTHVLIFAVVLSSIYLTHLQYLASLCTGHLSNLKRSSVELLSVLASCHISRPFENAHDRTHTGPRAGSDSLRSQPSANPERSRVPPAESVQGVHRQSLLETLKTTAAHQKGLLARFFLS